MALFNSMVHLCVPIEMEHVSLAGMGTPGKPQPIVQAAVGSELKPPGIVMPHTESETRKKILDKLSCRMLFQFVENRAPLTSQSVCTVTFSGSRSICTFLMGGGGVVMVMLIDFLVWWWCCRCCGEQRKQASSVNRSCILWNFGNFRPRLARLLLVWGPDGHIYKNVHMCECIIYFPRVLNITKHNGFVWTEFQCIQSTRRKMCCWNTTADWYFGIQVGHGSLPNTNSTGLVCCCK